MLKEKRQGKIEWEEKDLPFLGSNPDKTFYAFPHLCYATVHVGRTAHTQHEKNQRSMTRTAKLPSSLESA